jgi:hypothetical protein
MCVRAFVIGIIAQWNAALAHWADERWVEMFAHFRSRKITRQK